MKRPISTMVLTLGAAALLACPAFAQRPGRGGAGFGGMGGGAGLLMNPGVQKELKLDSDQTTKVEAIARDTREKHADDFSKLSGLEGADRREKMVELTKTISSEVDKSLAGVLKPDQVKRYHQIRIQTEGLMAFADPEVASKLNLTADQKTKIREIAQANQEKMRDLRESAGDDRQEAMKKMQSLRKESTEKALAVLSSEQKDSWKELTGEPFEFQFQGRRPNN